jgi:hypothetical protein
MELDNALDQIAQIHRQIGLARTFRGYRALTTFFTAIVAMAAALFQPWWIPQPARDPLRFVELWIAVAIICLIVVAVEMTIRFHRSESSLNRRLTTQAIEQLLPFIAVGGLVTLALSYSSRESLWLLPGFWSIFFGLGVIYSRSLLPRPIGLVGAFYLLAGVVCLTPFAHQFAFSPWTVAAPFGIGQSAAAFILYWSLERTHESQ